MKKALYLISSVLFAVAVFSCNKDNPEEIGPEIITPGSPVTISLNIPEKGLTKVDLTQDADPDGPVKLAWESTDVITVKNAADESKSVVFDYESGAGTTTASFTAVDASALEGATSYNIYLSSGDAAAAEQHQDADEDTGHLGYTATLLGVNKLNGATFSSDWAEAAENGSGTFVSSSVLRLRVQLPSGVAATVQAVTFKADQDIFLSGKTLKVIIDTPGDAGSDNILNVYATLPGGAVIPAGTNLLFQFQVSDDENNLLTAHRLITPANTFNEGKVNALKISCPNIRSFANQSTASIGTISNPYLIGDRNQLAKIKDNLSTSEKRYFKLVDDITVSSWTSIDSNTLGTINLDGNDKTINGLNAPLFEYLDGEVSKLTISGASISAAENNYGVLARTISKGDCSISNVTIDGGTVSAVSSVGGMIGRVEYGVTSCEITDCFSSATVTGTTYYIGGLIGFAANLTITGCSASGNVTSTSGNYTRGGGLIGQVEGTCSIEKCFATGNVEGTGHMAGGLIGVVGNDDTVVSISKCYATGNVTLPHGSSGNWAHAGGLLGTIAGSGEGTNPPECTIDNCFATGSIAVRRYSSGFVGTIFSKPGILRVTNSYTTSDITGIVLTERCGLFIGAVDNANSSVTCTSFVAWNTSNRPFSYNNQVPVDGNYYGTEGTILSQAQAFTAPNNWDFENVWNSVNPPTLK